MKTNRQKWQIILTAIMETQPYEIVCDEISDEMFARLAESFLAESELPDDLTPISQHLRQCPDCAQQLTDVTAALRLATAEDGLTLPLTSRQFDLAFLQSSPVRDRLPARVQVAFRRGVAWVQDQQGDIWISLAANRDLTSTPMYVSVTKGRVGAESSDGADVLYHLILGAEEVDDLDLEVIGRSDDESGFCILTVQAVIPSRWPQIGGVEVDLLSDSNVRHASTNDDGYAIFREIPVTELADIRVRVAR